MAKGAVLAGKLENRAMWRENADQRDGGKTRISPRTHRERATQREKERELKKREKERVEEEREGEREERAV